MHLSFQHLNSLPNSSDPSTSKLSSCCFDLIFHYSKISLTYNHSHLATCHGFHDVILNKPSACLQGASRMHVRKGNISYPLSDASHVHCISAFTLSSSYFVLLSLHMPHAWTSLSAKELASNFTDIIKNNEQTTCTWPHLPPLSQTFLFIYLHFPGLKH